MNNTTSDHINSKNIDVQSLNFIHCVEAEVIARNTNTRFILGLSLEYMKHGFEKINFAISFKTISEWLFFKKRTEKQFFIFKKI